jgi:hypothetical protein
LSGPGDPARERRLDWAKLLRRAWAFDVLVCALRRPDADDWVRRGSAHARKMV